MTEQWWLNWDFVLSDNQSLVFANGFTHLVPRMFFNIICSVSFIWVCFHYLSQQIGALFADVFGHRKLTAKDLLVKFVCIAVFEGQVACHHSEEDYTTWPNVNSGAKVSIAFDHFRCRVAWRATSSFQSVPLLICIAKAEINQSNLALVI